MTSVNNLSNVVQSAAINAGSNPIANIDIDKILATLENEMGKDWVTLTELHTIDSTLDRLAQSGKITQQRADTFRNQIRGSVNRAVERQQLSATTLAKSWLKYSDTDTTQNEAIRKMAQEAATNPSRRRRFWFGHANKTMSSREVSGLLKTAAEDGKITLSEINAMYQGVHDAFKGGQISRSQHTKLIGELETHLKRQAGKRRGGCAHRIKGRYHEKLTDEAKDFIRNCLGGKSFRSRGKGWTTWRFDRNRVQSYTRAICKDGQVSPAERQALMNKLLRDGRVTSHEMLTVRQAFAWAAKRGDISHEEYRRTVKIFEVEIAKMTGGVRADTLAQQFQVEQSGQFIFHG